MSLLTKGGITKLSELQIDADKDWSTKGISNVKQLAAAMAKGDLLVHGGVLIQRFQPGTVGNVLTSGGPGHLPSWLPGAALEIYIPATIESSHAQGIVTVDQSHNKAVALATEHKEAYLDTPADLIKRVAPAVALTDAETAGITPDQTDNENVPVTRKYDLEIVVGGAVADDGGVETDETTQAQNATVNDMTLLPNVPVVGDAYDFGFVKMFDVMKLNLGTQGDGVWTITWKYWNGAWVNLAGVIDGTDHFRAAAGLHDVSFTRPGDWALKIIQAMNLYWIRAEVTAYTSIITVPKGTQAWIRITT